MLSKRVGRLQPSPTLALAAKAKELKAQGQDVISLSVGEPDWDTFDVAKQAGIRAIQEGQTKYTPASGTPELRQSIARQTNADLQTSYSADQVTVSTGGKFIIFSALQCLLDAGDEVIIPVPYWVSYPTMVELAGGVPVLAESGRASGFKLTPERLESSLTEKTKILILNSPSNPTGNMYSKDELSALAAVLKKYPHVVVLSDDIYNRLVFESRLAPHLLLVAPELGDRTIVINGVSKTYSMTGWRVGWALGPKQVIQAMNKYQSQSVSCASTISQQAALAAIEHGEDELKTSMELLKKRRDFVCSKFKKLPNVELDAPDGAFYIWPDFSRYLGKSFRGQVLSSSRDLAQALLESRQVVAVPGVEFGLEGYLRVSYALSEERMSEAVSRISDFLSELK